MFNDILPSLGITVKFVDVHDPKAFSAAVDDKTRAFFCETVSNPSLVVADLEAISHEVSRARSIPRLPATSAGSEQRGG